MRFKQLVVAVAIVAIGGTSVAGCRDGRPGHSSDRNHRDRDRDHGDRRDRDH